MYLNQLAQGLVTLAQLLANLFLPALRHLILRFSIYHWRGVLGRVRVIRAAIIAERDIEGTAAAACFLNGCC